MAQSLEGHRYGGHESGVLLAGLLLGNLISYIRDGSACCHEISGGVQNMTRMHSK